MIVHNGVGHFERPTCTKQIGSERRAHGSLCAVGAVFPGLKPRARRARVATICLRPGGPIKQILAKCDVDDLGIAAVVQAAPKAGGTGTAAVSPIPCISAQISILMTDAYRVSAVATVAAVAGKSNSLMKAGKIYNEGRVGERKCPRVKNSPAL